ncbi:hypothetical protein QI3_1181 [Clostridioides difficile 842]|nr:hypothetical protein QC7_1293 [Clostridioides difficile CD38]EQE84825.1 hypothetical protein QCQ_1347 [Clostridioides difficile CD49]EQF16279.1 hypothetical protein QEQ_1226 [Clostridioides difficile CD144]EQF96248.1 hypothetical protein QI3_1181 [Clostridioides difficile 842]EQG01266.1 hypothetical protein QGY_1204 [Clostridioides difficile 840]EQG26824.1 hypothetical protein QII_1188 [Clostridioides difficile DA00114]EQG48583.1 hypothetical protein QIS_1204 [Clostridioides difficile DA00
MVCKELYNIKEKLKHLCFILTKWYVKGKLWEKFTDIMRVLY